MLSKIVCLLTRDCIEKTSKSGEYYSQWGDFVSGIYGTAINAIALIISTATLIYVVFTYKRQKASEKKQFEINHYYALMKICTDITKEIKFNGKKGRLAFGEFMSEWCAIYKKVSSAKLFSELENIDISYAYFFYGATQNAQWSLRSYNQNNIKVIHQLVNDLKTGSEEKRFNGNQQRIGHYFRSLYNCFKMLDECEMLTREEKYNLGKGLRSQLSIHEQALIAINSLSGIGKNWGTNRYFEKFQIIKNLPETYFSESDMFLIRSHFPGICWEIPSVILDKNGEINVEEDHKYRSLAV